MAEAESRRFLHSRWFWAAAVLIALVAGLHVLVPPVALRYVNRKLSNMQQYTGHVDDMDLSLLRGGIVAQDLRIWDRDNGSFDAPLVRVPEATIRWPWRDLWAGRQIVTADLAKPSVHVIHRAQKAVTGKNLGDELRGVFGDRMRSLHIEDGHLRLDTETDGRSVRLAVHELHGDATGLLNRPRPGNPYPARVDLRGRSVPPGSVHVDARFDPKDPARAFEMATRLQTKRFQQWNSILAKAAGFEVKSGELTLNVDLVGRGGKVDGSVRAYLRDLEISDFNGDHSALVAKVKAALLGADAEILEHDDARVIAARALIHGDLDQPGTSVWSTAWSGVRHVFAPSTPGRKEAWLVQPAGPATEPPPAHR
jgi:hypothetical protein